MTVYRQNSDIWSFLFQLSPLADDHGDRISSAKTEGTASDLLVAVVEGVDQSGHHTCSGTSDGVSECDSSSVDVEDLVRYVEILLDRTGCSRECLIVLKEIDVIDGHSCLLENVPGGGNGSLHDVLGLDTALTLCYDGCERYESMLLREGSGTNYQCGCSVAEL